MAVFKNILLVIYDGLYYYYRMYTFTKFDTLSCHGLHMIMFVSRAEFVLSRRVQAKKRRTYSDRDGKKYDEDKPEN